MNKDMEKYYEENGKKVYLYLMTLCNDPDTAEELTQETFYQAIKGINSYKGNSTVYTWLCGIAKNLWLAELRKRKRHGQEEIPPDMPDNSPPPDSAYESKTVQMSVLRQIHGLPETEKEIILLRASAGLTFKDIGEIFGKTENWARVTYYRAKQKLKKE